jgi:O-acetyl-ADP-ribose deacetylase (regulator of RNase III)
LDVDAIVNAANRTLLWWGWVDWAIHAAAWLDLLTECRTLHWCETWEAKLTSWYRLPAKYVIHTVWPIWRWWTNWEPELLKKCYENSLAIADKEWFKTIAFPSISTGMYWYPVNQAAKIAVNTIVECLEKYKWIGEVIISCFDDRTETVYKSILS